MKKSGGGTQTPSLHRSLDSEVEMQWFVLTEVDSSGRGGFQKNWSFFDVFDFDF